MNNNNQQPPPVTVPLDNTTNNNPINVPRIQQYLHDFNSFGSPTQTDECNKVVVKEAKK